MQFLNRVAVLPYDPLLLLRMSMYLKLQGFASPARWHQQAPLKEAVQWLGHGYTPSRRTWYDFRDRAGKFIEDLHKQVVARRGRKRCQEPFIGQTIYGNGS